MYYIGAYIAIVKPAEHPTSTLTAGGKSASMCLLLLFPEVTHFEQSLSSTSGLLSTLHHGMEHRGSLALSSSLNMSGRSLRPAWLRVIGCLRQYTL